MLDHHTIDDTRLFYQRTGPTTAPALVFLHGFSGNHLAWWQQIPAFADAYDCIATDQRMFGLSRDHNNQGASAVVTDLEATLDHTRNGHAVIVGHSMSGWTAASFATQHPDRTTALVLSGTPGGLIPKSEHDTIIDEHEPTLPDPDDPPPEITFLADTIKAHNRHAPAEFDGIRPDLDRLPIDPDHLAQADIPVLLIAGEADHFMPPTAVHRLADHLDADHTIIDGAGHNANFEKPTRFNQALTTFLTTHTPH